MLVLKLLVLMYVHPLKQGSLMMYLDAPTGLVSWFYARDHTYYAKWMPVYLKDMVDLTMKHPDIVRKFIESHFIVQKT